MSMDPCVLVVDGYPDCAETLAVALAMAGFQVGVCHDGREAWDLARALRPVAVVSELELPGMSGIELCRRLRAQPWAGALRLVCHTAWHRPEDYPRALRAGFDEVFVKPARVPGIVRAIGRARVA